MPLRWPPPDPSGKHRLQNPIELSGFRAGHSRLGKCSASGGRFSSRAWKGRGEAVTSSFSSCSRLRRCRPPSVGCGRFSAARGSSTRFGFTASPKTARENGAVDPHPASITRMWRVLRPGVQSQSVASRPVAHDFCTLAQGRPGQGWNSRRDCNLRLQLQGGVWLRVQHICSGVASAESGRAGLLARCRPPAVKKQIAPRWRRQLGFAVPPKELLETSAAKRPKGGLTGRGPLLSPDRARRGSAKGDAFHESAAAGSASGCQ